MKGKPSYNQYRFVVNKTIGQTTEHYDPARWMLICDNAEQHGFDAALQRRLVSSMDIKPLLGDCDDGWIYLPDDDMAISPWEDFAVALFDGS